MKAILAALALLAVSIPLMANPPSSMPKPQPVRTPSVPVRVPTTTIVRPAPVVVRPAVMTTAPRHHYVYFRYDPSSPWQMVGWTPSRSDAQSYVGYYQSLGYDAFAR